MYTEDQVKYITREYEADPSRDTVDRLAVELGVSFRSIIGKLSKLGIYRSSRYVPKYAEKVVSKEELVAQLEHALDVQLPGLAKSQKPALLTLVKKLEELQVIGPAW